MQCMVVLHICWHGNAISHCCPGCVLLYFQSVAVKKASASMDHGSSGVQWHKAHLEVPSQVQGPFTGEDAEMAAYSKHVFSAALDYLGRVCVLFFFFFFPPFTVPERRGIIIVTAKLNSLLMKGERRISCHCGKRMVNAAGSH